MGVFRPKLKSTVLYMSLEIVAKGEHSLSIDTWALRCVVEEIVIGAITWHFFDVSRFLMRIGGGTEVPKVPKIYSTKQKIFLKNVLIKNPSTRWKVEMLLNQPFLDDDKNFNDTLTLKDRQKNNRIHSHAVVSDYNSHPM